MKARQVFRDLGLEHPTEAPIETLAFMRGALARKGRLDGAEGRLVQVADRAIVTVSDRIDNPGRERFVVAHELGHHELHRDGGSGLSLCTDDDFVAWRSGGADAREAEANAFAAEFLMPEALFAPRCDVKNADLRRPQELAALFQVSLTAAALRFVQFCPERCCLVMSKDGKVAWAWPSEDFGYWIERGRPLDSYSLAFDFFKKGAVSKNAETVSASSWVDGPRVGAGDDLVEHSIVMPAYRCVLSLLWIKSDAAF